ncbi:MAG: oligopeptide:H+ symporter [Enterobacterales bacterium]|nr:oligopeptide:H+ symporter [Enterobacterales bacterium]
MRKAVIFGASLLVLGHLGMAYEGVQATKINGNLVQDTHALNIFYLSLSLIIVGVGFLKPNISTIVGKLYAENDPRRDSGFTIFYAGINLGATIAPLICAYLGETYGWKYGFGLAGIGMIAGLVLFIYGQKYLNGHAESNYPEKLVQKHAGLSLESWIYLGGLLAVGVIWILVQTHSLMVNLGDYLPSATPVTLFLHTISIILLIGMSWYVIKFCNKVEREQMLSLVIIIVAGLLFFALYEQTYGSWVAFSDRVMDRKLMGAEWSAGQLTAFGAFFIILLTPFFAWLWPELDRRNKNPSTAIKMAIGLFFCGIILFGAITRYTFNSGKCLSQRLGFDISLFCFRNW